MSIEAMKQALEALESATPKYTCRRKDQKTLGGALDYWKLEQHQRLKAITTLRTAIAEAERKEHAERLSLKGWQYFECPACGSEGARAFPQPEQEASRPIYIAEVTMPDPDEIGPWCDGTSWCLNCHHEWVAVWPLGAESLECPACGSTDTDRDQAEPHERKTK
jgi:Zn finger protein HypA/HybF involved in hydrogenase expression